VRRSAKNNLKIQKGALRRNRTRLTHPTLA